MALKAKLTEDEYAAAPDAVKGFYKKGGDGAFVLDAEGVEDVAGLKSALAKERESRKSFETKVRELSDKWGDMDPEQAKAALVEIQKLQDKKLIDEGKIEELLNARTEQLRKEFNTQRVAYEGKVKNLETENGKLTGRLEEVLIDSGLTAAAATAKVRPAAMMDLLLRGRRVWKLHEGKPTPFRDDGEVLYGKDPKAPMTMEEWVSSLSPDAPHLFEDSKGTGSEPNPARGTGARITLTRDQARDVRTWRSAQDQAARTGAQVVVQD